MRYYKILLTPAGGQSPIEYSSLNDDGTANGGALNIELDAPVAMAHQPSGSAWVRIWGVGLDVISQSNDLNNATIEVYGGMSAGLPLANAAQAGLLFKGYVFQAFGNWIGVDQTLDLVVQPGSPPGSSATAQRKPKNIILNWKKGASLADAVKSALQTAFPDLSPVVNVSSNLVLSHDEIGYYGNLTQFAQYVRDVSRSIIKDSGYLGVGMVVDGGQLKVFDGQSEDDDQNVQVNYSDLIGQPTWIGPLSIQTKVVMRSGLEIGKKVKMPQTATVNTQAAASSLINQAVVFQGDFTITNVRHVGNFRQPDANAWVSVFDAVGSVGTGAQQ